MSDLYAKIQAARAEWLEKQEQDKREQVERTRREEQAIASRRNVSVEEFQTVILENLPTPEELIDWVREGNTFYLVSPHWDDRFDPINKCKQAVKNLQAVIDSKYDGVFRLVLKTRFASNGYGAIGVDYHYFWCEMEFNSKTESSSYCHIV